MKRNIKISYEKKDNSINEKYYITKNEFKSVSDNVNILKYIRIMKKVKNINYEQLLNNIFEILFEISTKNVNLDDIKIDNFEQQDSIISNAKSLVQHKIFKNKNIIKI